MTDTARQLTLDLPLRPAFGAEDFLVTPCNERAVAFIDQWPDWSHPVLCLFGPEGAGKSHVACVWQEISGASCISADQLDEARVPGLIEAGHVVVEDLENLRAEDALFHLINLAREEGRSLLLTARQPASRLDIALPDLRSRLNAAPAIELAEPDDQLMKALFMKLFADRQLAVKAEVIDFLTLRVERSYAAIAHAVEGLDELALSSKRPITVPLARDWLDKPA